MNERTSTSAENVSGAVPLVVQNHSVHAKANRESGDKSSKQEKEESDSPFAVSVTDVYEGPLDLLLDLIRKQDIDIYDIPIARITEQYLAYVEKIRELDVNVAADFIYMAAVPLTQLARTPQRQRPGKPPARSTLEPFGALPRWSRQAPRR